MKAEVPRPYLKPCPFCGTGNDTVWESNNRDDPDYMKPVIHIWTPGDPDYPNHVDYRKVFQVICWCGADGPEGETEVAAYEAWNDRSPP